MPEASLRPLNAVIGDKPIISPVLIEMARWMADYYCCPVETAMRSVLPQVIRDAEVDHKTQLFARLARAATPEELAALGPKKAPRVRPRCSPRLRKPPRRWPWRPCAKSCGATHQTIQSLVKAGLVETASTAVGRDPYAQRKPFVPNAQETLMDEQAAALARSCRPRSTPRPPKKAGALVRRHRQRQDRSLSPGHRPRARTRADGVGARPGNLAHAADGRALQEPIFHEAGSGRRAAQPPFRRRAARRMAQDSRRQGAHRHRRALGGLRAACRTSG